MNEREKYNMWRTHIQEQLETELRESKQRLIRIHVWARWWYIPALLLNIVVAIYVLILGRIPYISGFGIVVCAVLWWISERRLKRIREEE